MEIRYEDCLNKGLIRPAPPSSFKAGKSMEKAERFLVKAERNFREEDYDTSVIMAYLASLNAARAVLIRDGRREKSHACVARYIERYYVPSKIDGRLIRLFDRFRNMRHDDQYDVGFYAQKADAEGMIGFAKEFITAISRLLSMVGRPG